MDDPRNYSYYWVVRGEGRRVAVASVYSLSYRDRQWDLTAGPLYSGLDSVAQRSHRTLLTTLNMGVGGTLLTPAPGGAMPWVRTLLWERLPALRYCSAGNTCSIDSYLNTTTQAVSLAALELPLGGREELSSEVGGRREGAVGSSCVPRWSSK